MYKKFLTCPMTQSGNPGMSILFPATAGQPVPKMPPKEMEQRGKPRKEIRPPTNRGQPEPRTPPKLRKKRWA